MTILQEPTWTHTKRKVYEQRIYSTAEEVKSKQIASRQGQNICLLECQPRS